MGGRSGSFGKKAGGGAKLDLPELEGSEKQIKWAKDIRQKWLDKINSYEKSGETEGYDEDRISLINFAERVNMGDGGSTDADFPDFETGGTYKGWLKDSYDDSMSMFSPSEKAEQQKVKSYYTTAMAIYNKYAPKGDYPKYVKGDKSSLKAMRGYEEKEKHAYRKMLTTMARKAVNKETNASNYINYYRL